MTAPEQAQPTSPPERALAPVGVRVASTLCWVVGVLTVLAAFALGIPALSAGESPVPFIVNLAAGLVLCVGGFLVRRQLRTGALVVVLAWAAPTAFALVGGHTPRGGPFLLFVAVLFIGANWKYLH